MTSTDDSRQPAANADPVPSPSPSQSPSPSPSPSPAPSTDYLTLTCTNKSTIRGESCFLVYPPKLILAPSQPQVSYPMVSNPTVCGADDISVAVMSWAVPPAELSFFTLVAGQPLANATPMPVELAQTVTVSWVKGQLEAVAAAGGPAGAIAVVFQAGIPAGASVGLNAGPGPVVFDVPSAARKVTITLNTTPTYEVRFGTLSVPDGFSDLSDAKDITFSGPNAYLVVGPENLIRQTN